SCRGLWHRQRAGDLASAAAAGRGHQDRIHLRLRVDRCGACRGHFRHYAHAGEQDFDQQCRADIAARRHRQGPRSGRRRQSHGQRRGHLVRAGIRAAGRIVMLRRLTVAGLVVAALGNPAAHAQNATFFTATYIEAGPVLAKVAASALSSYRDAARKEGSAAILDVFQRVEQPNQFVVLGAWADQKTFEAHVAGDASKKLNEKLATLVAAPADIRTHSGLVTSPARTGKDPVIVVTHVDVVPAEKDNGANALEQLADSARKQSGNLRFDVWRQTG